MNKPKVEQTETMSGKRFRLCRQHLFDCYTASLRRWSVGGAPDDYRESRNLDCDTALLGCVARRFAVEVDRIIAVAEYERVIVSPNHPESQLTSGAFEHLKPNAREDADVCLFECLSERHGQGNVPRA